jgi:hypothetical protein
LSIFVNYARGVIKMKKFIISTAIFTFLAMGGLPYAHNLFGRDWGNAVSSLARTYPGAVADHIRS